MKKWFIPWRWSPFICWELNKWKRAHLTFDLSFTLWSVNNLRVSSYRHEFPFVDFILNLSAILQLFLIAKIKSPDVGLHCDTSSGYNRISVWRHYGVYLKKTKKKRLSERGEFIQFAVEFSSSRTNIRYRYINIRS